ASKELAQRAEQQVLLLNELSHRVKNSLASAQYLVMQTLSDQRSMPETRGLLLDRLHALGRAHDALIRTDWRGAPLKEIISSELAPYSERVELKGPDLLINGKMVQALTLLLHELATNASKHGSLSGQKGKVVIAWSTAGAGPAARLKFRWEE